MRKYLSIVLLALALAWPVTCRAQQSYLQSSGVLSSSGTVGNGRSCVVGWIAAVSDGTHTATVSVYNGTNSPGTLISPTISCPAGGTNICGVMFPVPMGCQSGVYVAISGTGATALIGYIQR